MNGQDIISGVVVTARSDDKITDCRLKIQGMTMNFAGQQRAGSMGASIQTLVLPSTI